MKTPLNYASLAGVRQSVAENRISRFVYKGEAYEAEMHRFDQNTRTGAYRVTCYITRGPAEGSWQRFPFAGLRDFQMTSRHHAPRQIPKIFNLLQGAKSKPKPK
jgi:hypothetical protein